MKIFIVRHGNTFGEDQIDARATNLKSQSSERDPGSRAYSAVRDDNTKKRIFMSGSQNNIPLVNSGREQARDMAVYLDHQNITPTAIYANHLIRTWEHATIIREYFYHKHQITIPLYLNENLLEIDYGNWSGLTSEGETADTNEIIAKFGKATWDKWQKERVILNEPPHHWQPTREVLIQKLRDFFALLAEKHAENDVVIAIGSQGSITFMNALLEGGMERAIAEDRYKIKPGRFVELDYSMNQLTLINWNKQPA